MSVFEQVTAAFAAEKYDPTAFKNLQHEESMFVRELYPISRDEFCRSIDKLIESGWKNWKDIELIHKNQYALETRLRDEDEVVTRLNLKKDGLIWRSIVSRIPYKQRH